MYKEKVFCHRGNIKKDIESVLARLQQRVSVHCFIFSPYFQLPTSYFFFLLLLKPVEKNI